MSKLLLNICALFLAPFLVSSVALSIDAQKFCGPHMKTYLVEDLNRSRIGNGIRCVSPDFQAFYGEGSWGRSQSGAYKQMGVLKKNELGYVSSLKVIDLGLRRRSDENCDVVEMGQPGIREFDVKAFARPDLYGKFQTGFVVSGLNERWIEIEDTSLIDLPPFEGVNDANDCMTFTGVQYAELESGEGFRCMFSGSSEPSQAFPQAWISKNKDGAFGFGWMSTEDKYSFASMNCGEKEACLEASGLQFVFAMPTPPRSNLSIRLMGELEERWEFMDPAALYEPPQCHLNSGV